MNNTDHVIQDALDAEATFKSRRPKEVLSKQETLRRTATPPGQDFRHSHLDPKTLHMTPPRGAEPIIVLSRGW
jgi:hypothetical protein